MKSITLGGVRLLSQVALLSALLCVACAPGSSTTSSDSAGAGPQNRSAWAQYIAKTYALRPAEAQADTFSALAANGIHLVSTRRIRAQDASTGSNNVSLPTASSCETVMASGTDQCVTYPGDTAVFDYVESCTSQCTVTITQPTDPLPPGVTVQVSPSTLSGSGDIPFTVTVSTSLTTPPYIGTIFLNYTSNSLIEPTGQIPVAPYVAYTKPCCYAQDGESGGIFPGDGSIADSESDFDNGALQATRSYNNTSGQWYVGPDIPGFSVVSITQGSFSRTEADLRWPDGHGEDFYSDDGNVTWYSDVGVMDQIAYQAAPAPNGAVWTVTGRDGSVTQFDVNRTPLTYTPLGGTPLSFTETIDTSSHTGTWALSDPCGNAVTWAFNLMTGTVSGFTTPSGAQTQYGYDGSGNLNLVTYPDGTTRQYGYTTIQTPILSVNPNTPRSQLSSITDEKGNVYRSWGYDGYGRATSVGLAGGVGQYAISYPSLDGGSATVTDPLGTTRTFTYQGNGDGRWILTNTTQPCDGCGDNISSRTVGTNGQIIQTQDFNGNATSYGYDFSRNLVTSITTAAGTSAAVNTTYTWDPVLNLPTQISEPGRTTALSYNSFGEVLTKTITDTVRGTSRSWSFTYNSNGQMLTATDPNSNVTKYTYDASCKVASITDPLGHLTTFGHSTDGYLTQKINPNGLVAKFGYDPRGRLTSRIDGSLNYGYGYDPAGNLTDITLPGGYAVTQAYDNAHRLTGITDNFGNSIQYALDNAGNRTGESRYNGAGATVYSHSRVFDALGRLAQDIGASGQKTIYQYDGNSNLTSITDPLSHVTQDSYDAFNRLVQTKAADSGITGYSYNALDQLIGVTDPRTLSTAYTVDALGNTLQVASPDSGTSTSTPDPAGNITGHVDAKGQNLQYQYDALNRPLQVKRADTGQVLASFTYDQNDASHGAGIGRLTSMTDLSGSTNWAYDANGHVVDKTVVINGQSLATSYSYSTTTGNLQSMTLPSGKVVGYGWANGRINSMTLAGSPLVSGIVYEPFGGPTQWTLGNGEAASRTYDLDGRINADPVETIGYDAASRVTGWTLGNLGALTGAQGFGYDVLNRLTSYTGSGGPISYTYDGNGNRQTQNVNGTATTYTIDTASNRVTQQSVQSGSGSPKVTSMTYDANGSMTALGAASLTYDVQGHATNFSAWPFAGIYTYNGLAQRVEKQAGLNTLFVYDQASHLLGEYTTNGTPNDEIIYLGDMPVAVAKPGATYYVHADYRNTPRQIDNSAKVAVWEWDPTPFGDNQPNQQPSGSNPTFGFSLRFPGQYYDGESSLNKNMYRDYYASMGRYMESDPIGLRGGINTYAYVRNIPLRLVDRSGLQAEEDEAEEDLAEEYFGPVLRDISQELLADTEPLPLELLPESDGELVEELVRDAENKEGACFRPRTPQLVCRGGTCTPDRFIKGSGVRVNPDGTLSGVSVNSAPDTSLEELTSTIRNGQVGVTTLDAIEQAGGTIEPDPTVNNPYHCILCGLEPDTLTELFTPTVPNPNK